MARRRQMQEQPLQQQGLRRVVLHQGVTGGTAGVDGPGGQARASSTRRGRSVLSVSMAGPTSTSRYMFSTR